MANRKPNIRRNAKPTNGNLPDSSCRRCVSSVSWSSSSRPTALSWRTAWSSDSAPRCSAYAHIQIITIYFNRENECAQARCYKKHARLNAAPDLFKKKKHSIKNKNDNSEKFHFARGTAWKILVQAKARRENLVSYTYHFSSKSSVCAPLIGIT